MYTAGAANLEGQSTGLVGCLRNPTLKELPLGQADRQMGVQPCSDDVEPGVFIGADSGYTQLPDNVIVDLDLDIEVEIKPRTRDGVIFSVKGNTGDYLVLQMMNGELMFSMDNGAGEVITTYTPPTNGYLCNGQWHRIRGQKAKNVITLEVNSVFSKPGVGEAGVSRTDTNDPFFIGGVPVRHRGVKTTVDYVGCIRNLNMQGAMMNLAASTPTGDVSLAGCPTN